MSISKLFKSDEKSQKTEKSDWSRIVQNKVAKRLTFNDMTSDNKNKKQKYDERMIFIHPMHTLNTNVHKYEFVYPLDEERIKYYSDDEIERDWVEDYEDGEFFPIN